VLAVERPSGLRAGWERSHADDTTKTFGSRRAAGESIAREFIERDEVPVVAEACGLRTERGVTAPTTTRRPSGPIDAGGEGAEASSFEPGRASTPTTR
jgi:hypothetical protein